MTQEGFFRQNIQILSIQLCRHLLISFALGDLCYLPACKTSKLACEWRKIKNVENPAVKVKQKPVCQHKKERKMMLNG